MKIYVKYVECTDCGRRIPICNAHYINGKPYGYSCYKKQLALLYKQWEDEKNAEYSAKCFAAMQVFQGKKSNSFHDSICKQWNECKKLTARQLECIIKGFTKSEEVNFLMIYHQLSNDERLKEDLVYWIDKKIDDYKDYMENEMLINCLLSSRYYRNGLHFYQDTTIYSDKVYMSRNGSHGKLLVENIEDEETEVLKVVEGIQK